MGYRRQKHDFRTATHIDSNCNWKPDYRSGLIARAAARSQVVTRLLTCTLVCLLGSACTDKDTVSATDTAAKSTTPAAQTVELPPARAHVVEDRFARLAFDCVHREYPNKISHVMNSSDDARPPHQLTPMFYGCFDWHSSVHGHWLLVRILKQTDSPDIQSALRHKLGLSFTQANARTEVAYYTQPGRASFERPYGIAWYLQLVAELHESDDPQLRAWRDTLEPLESAIVSQVTQWLPKLAYPVRLGTHNQTAFAFGLMLDYARTVENVALEELLTRTTLRFYREDVNCPMAYEPSGEDFLSPCLMEADLMRRVLSTAEFATWLTAFLPDLPTEANADWLAPGVVHDATDGKLVHLDGVNLSRAWALEGIASALPVNDGRKSALLAAAHVHKNTGIAAVSDTHYAGSHWLASFALYLTSQRGIQSTVR